MVGFFYIWCMKKITTLLLIISPLVSFAKKTPKPNPCDSMKAIVIVDDKLSSQKICSNIEAALKSLVLHKDETLELQKIDDSTLVGSGIMIMTKVTAIHKSEIYGKYKIAHNADGNISYKLYINCKSGKFMYEFTNLHHYNAKYKYNDICASDYKIENEKEITGLRVTFLYRINEIVELMKRVNQKNDW